jgi:hypothetical protein
MPALGRAAKAVRIIQPGLASRSAKAVQRAAVVIPVEIGQQQDVGPGLGDHLHHGGDLGIGLFAGPGQVAQQKPRPVARQVGAIGGDPQRIRLCGQAKGGDQRRPGKRP